MNHRHSNITVKGLVAQDPRLARLLLPALGEALSSVASYTYRSLLTSEEQPEYSHLFDGLANDALRHFRTLGELILALGGSPTVYAPAHGEAPASLTLPTQFLQESLLEEKAAVERFETLMGKTNNRVVRSILSQIVLEKQINLRRLSAAV